MTMTEPHRVETERLVLRVWSVDDAPALDRLYVESHEHLAEAGMLERAAPPAAGTAATRIAAMLAAAERGERISYAAWDRASGALVGSVSLIARFGPGGREIGYWVHGGFVRRGLATEMAAAVTRVAFEVLRLPFVELRTGKSNAASVGVARALGYRLEATLPRRIPLPDGTTDDSLIFCLHADEFGASPSARRAIEVFARDGTPLSI